MKGGPWWPVWGKAFMWFWQPQIYPKVQWIRFMSFAPETLGEYWIIDSFHFGGAFLGAIPGYDRLIGRFVSFPAFDCWNRIRLFWAAVDLRPGIRTVRCGNTHFGYTLYGNQTSVGHPLQMAGFDCQFIVVHCQIWLYMCIYTRGYWRVLGARYFLVIFEWRTTMAVLFQVGCPSKQPAFGTSGHVPWV